MVPEGWERTTFEAHIDLLNGFAFKSEKYSSSSSDIKLLRGDNIEPGKLRWREVKRWPVTEVAGLEKYYLEPGDFVVAMDRTWIASGLKVAEVRDDDLPCLLVQRVSRIRAKSSLEQSLLLQYFSGHNFENYVKAVQTETAVPHISAQQIKEFPLLLPPLEEQKRIAKILSTWDKAITATEQFLKNSLQQKKALTQKLLGSPESTREDGGQYFKRISDIAERIQRKSDGGDHPILTISSINGFVRQDEKYSRFMAGKSVDSYILLKRGEFAYNKGNSKTYEFGCIFDLDSFDAGLVPHVYVCFKLKPGLSHRYFKYLFEADYLKPQLGQLVNTGVRNNGLLNIKPSEFMNTKVPVPSLEEQERIADILHVASKQIIALEQKLACLKQEKKALMQQLLTGKRRVTVDAKEVM